MGQKTLVQFLKLTFFLLLYLHFQGCFWYYIVSGNAIANYEMNNEGYLEEVYAPVFKTADNLIQYKHRNSPWFMPLDWMNYTDQYLYTNKAFTYEKYLLSLYHSVLFLGINEIGPVNINEIFISFILLLICQFLQIIIFGEIANLFSKYQKF